MNAGWKTVKLGEAAKIISGRNQREVESPNGPHPIIGSGGEMGRANETLCPADTTVIGRKGSINRPFFMSEPFWNVDTAFGISADRGVITPRFLHYFCLSFDFTTLNKGTTIPSLVKSDIVEIPIPLPPLAEQKRIVALLDEMFAGIDAAKAKAAATIEDVEELKASVLSKRLTPEEAAMNAGWKTVKLGEAAKIISGRNQREVESPNGPHPIIGSGGEMGRANETLCPADTTVIGRKGSINRPFFMSEPFWNVDTAFGISADRGVITPRFLHYFCLSFDFTTLNKGTTIPSLVKSDIVEIPIPLPPLAEQKRIVALLDEMFAGTGQLSSHASRKMSKLSELKSSLLAQAFAGELIA